MYKIIIIAFITISVISCIPAFADEKITLSTYYPAPYGEYRTLAVGDTYPAPAAGGNTDLVVEGNVGIGTTNPLGGLHSYSTTVTENTGGHANLAYNKAGYFKADTAGADKHYGVYSYAGGATDINYGIYAESQARGDANTVNYGIEGAGLGAGRINYGVYGVGQGATTNYGIYGDARDGTTNWAGYFNGGNVYINGNVGIGTTNPEASLEIEGTSGTVPQLIAETIGGSDNGIVDIKRARGTPAARTAVQSGDSLGQLRWAGFNGSDYLAGARIAATAENNFSSSSGPTRLTFATWSGSSLSEKMRITSTGNVGIGATAPSERLAVNGNIKLGTNAAFFAASSDTITRIIYENVESDGTMPWPTGQISVTKNGVGEYTINYVTSFLSVAAPAITVFGEGVAYATTKTATYCKIKIVALDGTPKDAQFSIIVAGRQ